jgi:hypothetical protein
LQAGAAGDPDRVQLSVCGDVIVGEYRIFGLRQRFAVAIYNDRPEWPIAVLRGRLRKLCGVAEMRNVGCGQSCCHFSLLC